MENRFEVKHFLTRKWLLSLEVNKPEMLPVASCSYHSLKSTCSQLKKDGVGEWKVSKKHCLSTQTRVMRIK